MVNSVQRGEVLTLDTLNRALLLENIHPDATARLTKAGYEVRTMPRALGEEELIEALQGISLLGIRSQTHVTGRVLAAAPDLLAVGAFCIGTNQVDLAAAAKRGVPVFNAPFSNTRSVVELAIAEIISMARRLPEKNAKMHEGVWDKSAKGAHEVRGRKLGIVGYGNIGTQLSVIAEALGMTVYFYDIADKLAIGNARRCSSLERAARVGRDRHAPRGRPLRQPRILRRRKSSPGCGRGRLFLNLSRGFVVDHAALRRHIESGHIAGAAIDVFPRGAQGQRRGVRLRTARPAATSSSPRTSAARPKRRSRTSASSSPASWPTSRTGGATSMSVNMPGVALPSAPGTHRLVHLHQNVPGVLATINRVLADHGVNVEGQLLRTRDDLGYVITDIVPAYSDEVLDQLRAMDVTIRLRTIESE